MKAKYIEQYIETKTPECY